MSRPREARPPQRRRYTIATG